MSKIDDILLTYTRNTIKSEIGDPLVRRQIRTSTKQDLKTLLVQMVEEETPGYDVDDECEPTIVIDGYKSNLLQAIDTLFEGGEK